jgi:hypothetical protein
MSISYSLAAEPVWYIVDLDGLAAGGAQLFTYDSETREERVTYQDAGGTLPNTNPIIANLNGTFDPIYWQIDTTKPDGYYIEVYDEAGTLLWQQDNFPSGSGGGGNTTTYSSFVNYIANNQFINHIPDTASPIGSSNLVIAPSNHVGFTPAQANPLVGTYGVLGPDIRFVKNNTGSTDQITFENLALRPLNRINPLIQNHLHHFPLRKLHRLIKNLLHLLVLRQKMIQKMIANQNHQRKNQRDNLKQEELNLKI